MWIFWGRVCPRGVVGSNVGCIPKNVDGMVTAGASMWPILNSASEEKQSSIRIVGYTKAIYANQRKKGRKKKPGILLRPGHQLRHVNSLILLDSI